MNNRGIYYKNIDRPLFCTERSIRPLISFLLFIYTVNTVFIPYDSFHLKVVSLIILLALGIRCWFVMENEKTILAFGLIVTSLTIIMSIICTGDTATNIRMGYMGYILVLFPIIKYYRIDYEKMLVRTIVVMAWFLFIMVFLDYFKVVKLNDNEIITWLRETENGSFNKKGDELYQYWMFLKTSPMLVIAMPYLYKKKRYINFTVVFLAMFFSGTRANQLVSLIAVFACIMLVKDTNVSRAVRIGIVLFIAAAILYEGSVVEYFAEYFSRKSKDDAVRRATKEAILEVWRNNPGGFLFGTGYSSAIFDPTRYEMMPIVEVSYWNLLRQIGVIPFLADMLMFIYPMYKLIKENRNIIYAGAFIGYLAICYNDPLLYSTTGMTVLLLMYCIACESKTPSENITKLSYDTKEKANIILNTELEIAEMDIGAAAETEEAQVGEI